MQTEIAVYAIYDKKGKMYDTPFFAVSDLFAKRRYYIMAEEEKSVLKMWPEDFALYRLAGFDTESGKINDDKELIIDGKMIEKKEDKK